jgi:diguanylate cyclase (GGDEF)-like protein
VSFYERTEAILAHLRRGESVAILSLDLDHFKNVNDTLGHPVGDFLLKQAADRMRNCVRGEDFVARLGGDEFAVVQVPSAEPPNIPALASRLIEFVGAPYEIDGRQVVVGLSVGIALAPADGEHPDVIMKNADLALYRAKADGGGTYRFFEAEMDARMQARRVLELELRRAVVNFEFELHYQPVVDVKSGRITSCEALIRWHHPERGMIPPLEFIPVAEETGLIVPIGEWVLTTACAEAARWPKDVTIAVNLSPAQFKSRNLVQAVKNALANSDLPARRLELEITELVLLQESDGAFVILHQLRDLGIRIAMDDFGTGYSSLGYLRSFPFDKIKIDKSFIQDLPGKEDSVAIVRAVVGLSSSLGITTTAEGVETKEQLAGLTSEGCDEFQGFLFSKPRSAADVEKLLREPVRRVGGAVG